MYLSLIVAPSMVWLMGSGAAEAQQPIAPENQPSQASTPAEAAGNDDIHPPAAPPSAQSAGYGIAGPEPLAGHSGTSQPAAAGVVPGLSGTSQPAAAGVVPGLSGTSQPAAAGVIPGLSGTSQPAAAGVVPGFFSTSQPAAAGVLPGLSGTSQPAAAGVVPGLSGTSQPAGPQPAYSEGFQPAYAAGPQPAADFSANPGPQAESTYQGAQLPLTTSEINHANAGNAAWSALAQARKLVRDGNSQQALPLIDSFISAKPFEPEGYFWEGLVLNSLNRPEQALAAFQKSLDQTLKSGMDSAELRMDEANALMKLGRVDAAINEYKRASTVDPELALVNLNLGRAYLQKGNYEDALKAFSRCDDLHFSPVQLTYYRTKALLKLGRTEDAKAQLNASLSKDSDSAEARTIKQEFHELLAE